MSEITDRLDTLEKRVRQFMEEYQAKGPCQDALFHFSTAAQAISRASNRRLAANMAADLDTAETALDAAFTTLG